MIQRIVARSRTRSAGRKADDLRAFPVQWSFLLGVVSAGCLVVLTVTGVILLRFYDPSSDTVRYSGSYLPLQGVPVSKAYDSTLYISLEVPAGLFVRQAHHWAALVLPGSLMLQMLSTFFTGGFRRPSQWRWVLLCLTFVLALAAGWSGYGLPDDLLAGTGLRIVEGIVVGIPFIGSWATSVAFGGGFPGHVIERMYWLHVVVLPLLLTAVLALRVRLAFQGRPAQLPRRGRTERNVVGLPRASFAVRSLGLFLVTLGVLSLMAGLVNVSPVWLYGPSSTASASAGSQPDWYTSFLDGALRLVPAHWEVVVFGGTVPVGLLVAQGAVGTFLGVVVLWPFLEARASGDRAAHHLLDRPRERPVRTGLGVAGLVFFMTLWAASASDVVATQLSLAFELQVVVLRATLLVGPPVAFYLTRQVCLALTARDHEQLLHGRETGRIMRSPDGGYEEVHVPLDDDRRALVVHASGPDNPEVER